MSSGQPSRAPVKVCATANPRHGIHQSLLQPALLEATGHGTTPFMSHLHLRQSSWIGLEAPLHAKPNSKQLAVPAFCPQQGEVGPQQPIGPLKASAQGRVGQGWDRLGARTCQAAKDTACSQLFVGA